MVWGILLLRPTKSPAKFSPKLSFFVALSEPACQIFVVDLGSFKRKLKDTQKEVTQLTTERFGKLFFYL